MKTVDQHGNVPLHIMSRIKPFLVSLGLCLGFCASVSADTTGLSGFDLRVYRPPADRSGVLNVHGAATLKQWQLSVGTITDTTSGLLRVTNPAGQEVEVVSDMLTADTEFAVGLTNFLQAGINIPSIFFEQGQNFDTLETFQTVAFGDIALNLKLRALKEGKVLPGLALISVTTVPSGNREKFTGDHNVTEEGRLAIDKKFGPVYVVVNGGYRALQGKRVVDLDIDDMLVYGAGLSSRLPFFHGFELMAEVDGSTVLSHPSERTSPLEWLVGIRQKAMEAMSYEIAGGARINDSYGGDWRIVVGVNFVSSSPDERSPDETMPETNQAPEEKTPAKPAPKKKTSKR